MLSLAGYGLLLFLLVRGDAGVDGGCLHLVLLLALWVRRHGVPGSEPEWQKPAPVWRNADGQKHIPVRNMASQAKGGQPWRCNLSRKLATAWATISPIAMPLAWACDRSRFTTSSGILRVIGTEGWTAKARPARPFPAHPGDSGRLGGVTTQTFGPRLRLHPPRHNPVPASRTRHSAAWFFRCLRIAP